MEGSLLVWPFYIVCDTSQSMHKGKEPNAYSAMMQALVALVDFSQDDVEAADIAFLSIITFSDDTQIAVPLQQLGGGFVVPDLHKGIFTNYARAFEVTATTMERDLEHLESMDATVKRPTVFFITDGRPEMNGQCQPPSEWEPSLQRLQRVAATRGAGERVPVAIVAMGFQGAVGDVLRQVSQSPGVACIADPHTDTADLLMTKLLKSILQSISRSVAHDDLVFTPPAGMRLC